MLLKSMMALLGQQVEFPVRRLQERFEFELGPGRGPLLAEFIDQVDGRHRRPAHDIFDGKDAGATLHNPDFVKLAEAFGAGAMRAQGPSELNSCLKEALADNRPTLIEVPVEKMPRGR